MREDEFMRFYDAFAEALFRHCYFRVSERERAKDLVQETFTRTWEYLSRGKEVENMRAFLYRVANNLIIDESRRKKALSLDELSETGFDPPDRSLPIAVTTEIREALALVHRLDEKHRDLIIMRYVDDLGPKEIAEIIGESENVVSVRLHRAVARLRKLNTPKEGDET